MRLHALLLVAVAVLHARAASIPVTETEKKLIDIVPDNLDKLPENTSSEQELIDQANSVNDVDNTLRVKPEDIPVEVVVENVQPALKNDDESDEEIIRPTPDLRNPGPPQRQEHETQNPEYYASEQETVLLFKQSVNDVQNAVRQGFQGIADGIQNVIQGNNEPIQTLHQSIQSLRDGFAAQMDKLNGTIQSYLNSDRSSSDQPAVEQTKAGFHQIEKGLFKLRSDFNKGVNYFADGVGLVASLRAENQAANPSAGASPAAPAPAPTPAPVLPMFQYLQNFQAAVGGTLQNFTETINRIAQNAGWNNPFNQAPAAPAAAAAQPAQAAQPAPATPQGAQSDTPVAPGASIPAPQWPNIQDLWSNFVSSGQNAGVFPKPGQFGSGSGPIASYFQNGYNNLVNIFQPRPGQATQGAQPAASGQPAPAPQPETVAKPEEPATKPEATAEPAKPAAETPAASTQTDGAAAVGPIRQILQNNPITKGITGAVQKLQNLNNPEKPRDAEVEKKPEEVQVDSKPKKGGPNTGGNNDVSSSSSSGVEQEEKKEVKPEENIPEQVAEVKPSEDQVKEVKAEEVADKTE
ncbi:unnamed protein product [Spodoptera littoralis]|uniref:Uncharacterized protein n=1 Tax=Spodoptera littoralis TaxID=7109 RepID=A0A9P0HZG3_SPOLI|nr:unnamed protein product [Spodoptera littoralis]CAH1636715.1 unnamed protein product [Spodoptera littoralis]